MEIPMGFRFQPSDEELVTYYLKKKVKGEPVPWNTFVERDIYDNKSPWEVLSINDPWDQDDDNKISIYLFTTQKLLGKKRIARTAGCGSWHGTTGPKKIKDLESGAVIAKKKMFTYISRDQTVEDTMGHWYMHEYTLMCSSFKGMPKFVICKITRDGSKKLKVETPPEQTKKKSVEVSDQEVENYSTAPQAEQFNANDEFLHGFDSEELDKILEECRKHFDFEPNMPATQDGDLEHAAKRTRYDDA